MAPKRLKMLDQADESSEKESEINEPQFVEEEKSELYRHLDDTDLELVFLFDFIIINLYM